MVKWFATHSSLVSWPVETLETELKSLPSTPTVDMSEFLFFVERNHLFDVGMGFVDAHLLASAKLSGTLSKGFL